MTPKQKLAELLTEYRRWYGLSLGQAVHAIRRDLQQINTELRDRKPEVKPDE